MCSSGSVVIAYINKNTYTQNKKKRYKVLLMCLYCLVDPTEVWIIKKNDILYSQCFVHSPSEYYLTYPHKATWTSSAASNYIPNFFELLIVISICRWYVYFWKKLFGIWEIKVLKSGILPIKSTGFHLNPFLQHRITVIVDLHSWNWLFPSL